MAIHKAMLVSNTCRHIIVILLSTSCNNTQHCKLHFYQCDIQIIAIPSRDTFELEVGFVLCVDTENQTCSELTWGARVNLLKSTDILCEALSL